MSAGHTPGPWVAWQKHKNGVRDRLGRYAVLKDGPGAREVIADNLRTQARANLIAAAPDLLRELSELVDWLHAIQRDVEGEFNMDDMLAGARAAIAKANGGAA